MQEVMQKRLAIVVMMVMTALKISLAVGFLLKNDIFTNFFLEFKIIIFFYLTRPLLLGEVPPPPRLPLLRRGLHPVNRLFCTRKQAHAPAGLLVITYATELRLFMRLWRPCGRGGMRYATSL